MGALTLQPLLFLLGRVGGNLIAVLILSGIDAVVVVRRCHGISDELRVHLIGPRAEASAILFAL